MTYKFELNVAGGVCFTIAIPLSVASCILIDSHYGILTCIGAIVMFGLGIFLTVKDKEQYQFIM